MEERGGGQQKTERDRRQRVGLFPYCHVITLTLTRIMRANLHAFLSQFESVTTCNQKVPSATDDRARRMKDNSKMSSDKASSPPTGGLPSPVGLRGAGKNEQDIHSSRAADAGGCEEESVAEKVLLI